MVFRFREHLMTAKKLYFQGARFRYAGRGNIAKNQTEDRSGAGGAVFNGVPACPGRPDGKPASDFSPRGRSNAWVDMLHAEAGTPPGGHDRYSESVEVEGEKKKLRDRKNRFAAKLDES